MKTIIICSGGEDGKDVRTAIRIEDELFAKMFGSHIKDPMSFDEVELYFEGYVDRLKATCNGQDIDMDTMATRIKSLEDKLEEMAKQRDYFKDELDKCKAKEKELSDKAKLVVYFKDELDKRDREIEQLKEAVVRANENADSYYKLYSSERDAHKKTSAMVDDLNTAFLEVREIVAKKCKHWAHTIWDSVNSLCSVSSDGVSYPLSMAGYSCVVDIRKTADDISDFGANNAQGLMEDYEKEEESEE